MTKTEVGGPIAVVRGALSALNIADKPAIALGLSGGPDSMALAWILCRLYQDGLCPPIHAVTVDHDLRADSADEASRVAIWVGTWPGFTHKVIKRTVSENDARILETARSDRYHLLEQYCLSHGIDTLFIAHHQDDQAETLLFRLAKGSGLDGLAAMRIVTTLPGGVVVCRPLLAVPKADLLTLCQDASVPFVQDPGNENTLYARPRLRAAQAVLAAEGLTPARLARTAERLQRASEALAFITGKATIEAIRSIDEKRIVFNLGALIAWPDEVRFRVLQRACIQLRANDPPTYGPRMNKLEEITAVLFAAGRRTRVSFFGCLLMADPVRNTLEIARE